MPLFILVGLLLLVLAFILLLPLSLVQRYRMGTTRQRARGWLSAVNLVGIAISCLLFLLGALLTNIWIPRAFAYSVAGMGIGGVLGLSGLALTRWEATPRDLHFTPNRFLLLAITIVIAGRLAYGVWRSWQAWTAASTTEAWIASSGAATSLGAGAVVLGYYLVYWTGVRRRLKKHSRRTLRRM